jgi:hypothetical protein
MVKDDEGREVPASGLSVRYHSTLRVFSDFAAG